MRTTRSSARKPLRNVGVVAAVLAAGVLAATGMEALLSVLGLRRAFNKRTRFGQPAH
ncbi:hypothetical protein [Actinophytocola oryzae]|uniref:Uncharacterized protein n=1 Tax=Actinophytocola oryzae TaxID=502181 RepID=A0A4R7W1T6_9PSEU|nr:hypothetical protein [Actinophytocola oryzae]TDV56382.1 hypothetical protein CLV71_102449 [Actinophytocola oryzae]